MFNNGLGLYNRVRQGFQVCLKRGMTVTFLAVPGLLSEMLLIGQASLNVFRRETRPGCGGVAKTVAGHHETSETVLLYSSVLSRIYIPFPV